MEGKASIPVFRILHSLGFLQEPLSRIQIFEHHNVPASFQNHLDATAGDLPAPPFVIDAPNLSDGLDRSACSRFRISHLDR
jgi:hypothetical protein